MGIASHALQVFPYMLQLCVLPPVKMVAHAPGQVLVSVQEDGLETDANMVT